MHPLFDPKRTASVRTAIHGRNLDDLLPLLRKFPVEIVGQNPELVIAYGGDGSLLGSEQRFPGIPKFALRDARQNPKCAEHREEKLLRKLFNGEIRADKLPKLAVFCPNGQQRTGLNDIVLARQQIASAIRYRITRNGQRFRQQVVADALVVATPFGSTGYFQSITRGTFLAGLGLAYPNAMDLNGFTVLPENSILDIELLRGPAEVVADNDPRVITLTTGDIIQIKTLPEQTEVFGLDAFRCPECFTLRRNNG